MKRTLEPIKNAFPNNWICFTRIRIVASSASNCVLLIPYFKHMLAKPRSCVCKYDRCRRKVRVFIVIEDGMVREWSAAGAGDARPARLTAAHKILTLTPPA